MSALASRVKQSKKLISHDIHSNTYNYKFTFGVEVVPMCRDNLVCLPKKVSQQMAGLGPLCLVQRLTSSLHLIDPATAQLGELSSNQYWRVPFPAVCEPRHLHEYIVMDLEVAGAVGSGGARPGQGRISSRHVVADAWVVRASDLGRSGCAQLHARTHLGHVLKVGDSALGYNLQDANVNHAEFERLRSADQLPAVVLVKKHYGERAERQRHRQWRLRHLLEPQEGSDSRDYCEFLEELEEDPELRQRVNIWRTRTSQQPHQEQVAVDSSCELDPSMPRITLEEMLDDLQLDDVDMEEVAHV